MYRKLSNFFNNTLGKKLFNKLFLLYSIIIMLTFLIFLFIIMTQVSSTITEQDISFNNQVIQTVDTYFSGKCRLLKNKMVSLYQDAYAKPGGGKTGKDVITFLRDYSVNNFASNLDYQQSVNSFIDDSSLNLNGGINFISIASLGNQRSYTSWRSASNAAFILTDHLPKDPKNVNTVKPKIYFVPAFNMDEYSKIFLLYDVIRDNSNLSKKLGYLVFGYGPETVKNAYAHYQPLLKGSILILSPDGGVMFDSGNTLYGQIYPYFDDVKAKGDGTIFLNSTIINVRYDDEFGFYTLGILPKKEIDAGVNSTNSLILSWMLISIATIMLLSYLSTVAFSSRVKLLIQGIGKIRHGDLSFRMNISGRDEIAEISSNLNLMCDRLDDYIKKEYIYKLRQREAELYTLQAQVNPHFLYNSLEAIRMTALKAGNSDVGRMVLLLADIFRGTVKEKIIVSIRDELNSCKSFLEFYNIRFEGRLDLIYRISDDILKYGILHHLIQPIVENVLVHGINLTKEDNVVAIEGYLEDGNISIVVRDNGRGITEDRLVQINDNLNDSQRDFAGSIGIFNVNQRIGLIYGEDYGVTVKSVFSEGTEVTIRIKARTIEELTLDVQGIAR